MSGTFFYRVCLILSVLLWDALPTKAQSDNPEQAKLPDRQETTEALAFLRQADGMDSLDLICRNINVIRQSPHVASEEAKIVARLLYENSPLYRDRIRSEIRLLRAALLVTLSETGVPSDALPVVVAELRTSTDPLTFGASCRVVQAVGSEFPVSTDVLLRPFGRTIKDELFSLDDLSQSHPLQNPTTSQQEALKAIIALRDKAKSSLPLLNAILDGRITSDVSSKEELHLLATQAAKLVQLKPAKCNDCCCKIVDPAIASWIPDSSRKNLDLGNISLTNDKGVASRFQDLMGKPILLTYFYTRCDNPEKCSRTVSAVGKFQQLLRQAHLADKVHLVLLTLDPVFDDPLRLRRYCLSRGVTLDKFCIVYRTTPADLELMVERLSLPVSYNHGTLSIHGTGCILLDSNTQIAKRYNAGLWDNDTLLKDFHVLLNK